MSTFPRLLWHWGLDNPVLAFDWARVKGLNTATEPTLYLHSWSQDGNLVLAESMYIGSPIDTIQSLYAFNLPAKAAYRIGTAGRIGAGDPGLVYSWNTTRQELVWQTREQDLGHWHWDFNTLTYRYQPGPRPARGSYRVDNLDLVGGWLYLRNTQDQFFKAPLTASAPMTPFVPSDDYGPLLGSSQDNTHSAFNGFAGYGHPDDFQDLCSGYSAKPTQIKGSFAGIQISAAPCSQILALADGKTLLLQHWNHLGKLMVQRKHVLTQAVEKLGLTAYPGQNQVYLTTYSQLYLLSLPDLNLTLIRDFSPEQIEQISLSPNRRFAALVSFGSATLGDQLWIFALPR
ncbi:MAG: hypothetical protein AB7I41_07875 [Candidatus Sericytochromatia bacterium]